MKLLVPAMCLLLLNLIAVNASSQSIHTEKKSLFSNYPSIIRCTKSQLSNFFAVAKGQNINVSFENNLSIEGPVISNTSKYSNLQTMVIKLPAFNNIFFSLSKITDENNGNSFAGHLFSKDYADGYELKHDNDGNYQFIKIETAKILPDCNQ